MRRVAAGIHSHDETLRNSRQGMEEDFATAESAKGGLGGVLHAEY